MSLNRRSFLRQTSIFAAATVIVPLSLLPNVAVASPRRSVPFAVSLSPEDAAAVEFLKLYASEIRLVGAGVLARIHGRTVGEMRILARIGSLDEMADALGKHGLGTEVYAAGNLLSLNLGETQFTIENLLPGSFDNRLTGLGERRNVAFAHDALSYDPIAGTLSDPFKAARAQKLKLVNPTFRSDAALGVILGGLVATRNLMVPADKDLERWVKRHLRRISRGSAADTTWAALLPRLAEAANLIPFEQFRALITSRLVSTALEQIYGKTGETFAEEFTTLRQTIGGEISNAAVWLALFLREDLETGRWGSENISRLSQGTRFQVLHSRKALLQAKQVMTESNTHSA